MAWPERPVEILHQEQAHCLTLKQPLGSTFLRPTWDQHQDDEHVNHHVLHHTACHTVPDRQGLEEEELLHGLVLHATQCSSEDCLAP